MKFIQSEKDLNQKIHEKIKFFLWLIGKDSLPTNEKRKRNHLAASPACTICSAAMEDADHLFRRCLDATSLWSVIALTMCVPPAQYNFQQWFASIMQSKQPLLLIATMWWLWRWRNDKVLGDDGWNRNQVMRFIWLDVQTLRRWPYLNTQKRIEETDLSQLRARPK